MAMELKQSLKLSQQLVMTPQLQQTIKLLQLSRLELIETIQEEMETNPLLEESGFDMEDVGDEDAAARLKPAQEEVAGDDGSLSTGGDGPDFVSESQEQIRAREEIDWENYFEDHSGRAPAHSEVREMPSFENFLTKEEDLTDHLLWQLRLSNFTDEEKRIGGEIIGNLDENGYLAALVEEIARSLDKTAEEVEAVLAKVQEFDPPGIAARNVRECLLIQIRSLDVDNPLVHVIVSDHLDLLEKKNYSVLCKKLDCTLDEVQEAVNVIIHLDPFPGRLYHSEPPAYITPDIYVHKIEDKFVVTLNEDGLPKLKVNNLYKGALNGSRDVESGTKDFIQNKLRSAVWLIKSIHQRQRTIFRVTESIVRFQREFFEKGIAHLKPLILKDVAEDISMHESTISRVTSNKYVHTPQGILNLKFFFNSAIERSNGDSIASESVKAKIRQIISGENPGRPHSDKKIVELLKKEQINIARRTVAKYREMMGILPSSKRKNPFHKENRDS